jgi:hypothetical protein
MLRLVELALFLAPFAIFIAWRWLAPGSGPSLWVMVGAVCVLAVLVGLLIWLSEDASLPPSADYVPAHLRDGHIVSGHAAPR